MKTFVPVIKRSAPQEPPLGVGINWLKLSESHLCPPVNGQAVVFMTGVRIIWEKSGPNFLCSGWPQGLTPPKPVNPSAQRHIESNKRFSFHSNSKELGWNETRSVEEKMGMRIPQRSFLGKGGTTVLKYPPETKKVPDDMIIFSKITVWVLSESRKSKSGKEGILRKNSFCT